MHVWNPHTVSEAELTSRPTEETHFGCFYPRSQLTTIGEAWNVDGLDGSLFPVTVLLTNKSHDMSHYAIYTFYFESVKPSRAEPMLERSGGLKREATDQAAGFDESGVRALRFGNYLWLCFWVLWPHCWYSTDIFIQKNHRCIPHSPCYK